MRSQGARIDVQAEAASDQYESQGDVPDGAATLHTDDGSSEEEGEDETPEEAVMDGRRPGISLIDLLRSAVVPTEYLWSQCAIFMKFAGTVPSAITPSMHGFPKTHVWSSYAG